MPSFQLDNIMKTKHIIYGRSGDICNKSFLVFLLMKI